MKKSKLLSVLLPTTVLASTLSALPLSSCSNSSKHVKLSDLCDANQKLDDNNEVVFILVLDNKDEVKVAFDGDDQGFKLDYKQSGNMVRVTLKFLSWVNEETTFDINFKITSSNWTENLSGLSVLVNAVAEQKEVNEINNILVEDEALGIKAQTMSEVVALLKLHDKDIESFETSDNTSQWVWDSNANRIFVLNDNGTVKSAPKDYSLSKYKVNIWKMVGSNQTSNLRSFTRNDIKIDAFSSTSQYSQYLRSDAVFEDKSLTFCSGLDTGDHTGFDLKFVKDETLTTEQPKAIINTNKCTLTVDSELNDIEHHGHLTSLTINEMPDDGVYTEFGTVDARVILNSGAIVAESGSSINDIVITSNDAVGVEVKAEATVGAVLATEGVTAEVEDLVQVDTGATTPTIVEEKQDPEQTLRYAGGIGEKNSPYVISTAQQLLNCQEDVNENGKSSASFILLNDIDMTGITTFKGIGTFDHAFTGTFDGKEYSISNLTISSSTSFYNGLFGYTNGTPNSSYTSKESVWDYTNNVLIDETIDESKYTTVIKNITLKSINYSVTNKKFTGGIVGEADNTFIYNCKVESGEIVGYKGVGGIAGTINGSVISDCTVGAQLSISAPSGYNVGGISGGVGYLDGSTASTSGEAIINSVNNANIDCNSTATGGYFGGIAGMAINDASDPGAIIDNCVNNGNLTNDSAAMSCTQCGIAGLSIGLKVISNSTNNGKIIGSSQANATQYAAGIAQGENLRIYNCINKGDITANAIAVAGIFANEGDQGGTLEIISCINDGELSNPENPTAIYSLAAGIKQVVLENHNFDNVAALNSAICSVSGSGVSLEMKNVIVADTSDVPLNLPSQMSSVSATNKVCDSVKVTQTSSTSRLVLDLPEANITVNDDCSNVHLEQHGDNATITIGQNGKLNNVVVTGSNSKIYNNGTVSGSLAINGSATYLENNGTCSSVAMSNINSQTTVNKHFVNNGTVKTYAKGANNHVLSSLYGSLCNITIDNYGTIAYENVSATVYGYLASMTNTGTNIMNCYSESELNSNVDSYKFSVRNLSLNYQTGAKFIDQGTEKDWTTLSFPNVVISHIE